LRPEFLQIQIEYRNASTFLTVVGELDMAAAPLLRHALDELVPSVGSTLSLDLAGISFVDSVGLVPILEARDTWLSGGGNFVITDPSAVVRRLVNLLNSRLLDDFRVLD
jgi:anti-sigma B factor antagonist